MARGAILIALIFLSMGAKALGAEIAWQGTLTLDFVDLPPLQFEGVGVATANGPGIGLDTLRFDGGITGSASTPLFSPPDPNFSLSVGASVALGAGTLGPFWPPQPLTANTLPIQGFAKLCIIVPGCGLYIGLPLSKYSGFSGVGAAARARTQHAKPPLTTSTGMVWSGAGSNSRVSSCTRIS